MFRFRQISRKRLFLCCMLSVFFVLLSACGSSTATQSRHEKSMLSGSQPMTGNEAGGEHSDVVISNRTYYDFNMTVNPDRTSLSGYDYEICNENDYPRRDWIEQVKQALYETDDYKKACALDTQTKQQLASRIGTDGSDYYDTDGNAVAVYHAGLYMDFDEDGVSEGVISLSLCNEDWLVLPYQQIYFVDDVNGAQLLDITSEIALSLVKYSGFQHFAIVTADGRIAGHKYEIFQVKDNLCKNVFSESDVFAPEKYGVFLAFSGPQNWSNSRLLVFWDHDLEVYRSIGGAQMSVEDFLEIWDAKDVISNGWFSKEELNFKAEQLQSIEVYGNHFYCVFAKDAFKIACFSRDAAGKWQNEDFDTLRQERNGDETSLIAWDVDFLAANEKAVSAPNPPAQ